ncbi:MAG: hypothetical protein WCO60_12635 [Verrucomicrobiota bacterium]
MDNQSNSQKRIARIYAGNLGYFRRSHYLRTLRLLGFLLMLALCAFAVFGYFKWGVQKAFSPGPLSENHAFLVQNCQACHTGSASDLVQHPEKVRDMVSLVALQGMDHACLSCHSGKDLHSPQLQTLHQGNAALSPRQSTVHASSCAACHREHAAPQRLALPANQACTHCHASEDRLRESRSLLAQVVPLDSAKGGRNLDLGDGVLRFIVPSTEESHAFESFSKGHPPFAYERSGQVDPAALKFNHARHARSDMPLINNRKLDCATCHQPEPNGAFYQPVRYDKHCQQCHSLQIQPSLPNLLIPHGDSEKVRLFLAGIESSFTETFRQQGVRDPVELSEKVAMEKSRLRQRGLYSLQDLERRVFLEGDPADTNDERLMRSGNPKFLTECAKCHTVNTPGGDGVPVVEAPNVAQRWLQKGAFSHLPHGNLECLSCHEGVTKSKLTSDILLPSQSSCTKCHFSNENRHAENGAGSGAGSGGVKSACQSCHHFHGAVSFPNLQIPVSGSKDIAPISTPRSKP